MKWFYIPLLIIFCISLSCKKKDKKKEPTNEKVFTYNSLTSDVNTLKQGDVTNIKANVSGTVTFAWSASAGDLFGNGNNVLFAAGSCCTGNHTITCTVTDEHNNTEAKSVVINVTS